MQLKRFSVNGFKNFRQPVVFENMGKICVIHGENNVGKSNVVEAMLLFFQLGDKLLTYFEPDVIHSVNFSAEELEQLGFKASEIFSFGLETPMILTALLVFEPNETELNTYFELEISIKLKKTHNHIECQNLSLKTIEGTEVDKKTFIKFFSRPFALIGVDRLINETEAETVRHIVPQTLLLKLYDIKDSPEPSIFEKWELFVSTLQRFNDVLGEGEFVSLFDRHANLANLVFQPQSKPRRRIPIEILGSGIQQVVAIVARLLVSEATLIAIEEPELNLRYTLQLRLREIFKDIIEAPVGPEQLFLSSHSPAFEFGQHFYAMRKINGLPTVELKSIKQALLFTHHHADSPYLVGEHAPLCYVSTDGLVRLPERIRQRLELEHGGGIVLLERKDTGHVELLTDNQFDDLFEEPVV